MGMRWMVPWLVILGPRLGLVARARLRLRLAGLQWVVARTLARLRLRLTVLQLVVAPRCRDALLYKSLFKHPKSVACVLHMCWDALYGSEFAREVISFSLKQPLSVFCFCVSSLCSRHCARGFRGRQLDRSDRFLNDPIWRVIIFVFGKLLYPRGVTLHVVPLDPLSFCVYWAVACTNNK